MSWNIQTPGDYINGPLTVVGVAQFNSNVGIGVAPSSWASLYRAQTIRNHISQFGFWDGSDSLGGFVNGAYINPSYSWTYSITGKKPSMYVLSETGKHIWSIAGTGTAGGAVTWASAMTLDDVGDLAIGGNPMAKVSSLKDGGSGVNGNTLGSAFGASHAQVNANALSYAVRCTGSTLAGIGGQAYSTQIMAASAQANAMEIFTIGGISLIFGTASAERARFNPTGAFVLAGGATAANGIGIAFPSAQSASTDANTLDDYEEGTYSPTVAAAAGTPTTTTVNSAVYTKIGRIVVVQIDITVVNKGTASSSLIFSLPFNQTAAINTGAFRETAVTGLMGVLGRNGTTDAFASMYDNTTPWVNGYRIAGTYTYHV